jgi:hypothetical protein
MSGQNPSLADAHKLGSYTTVKWLLCIPRPAIRQANPAHMHRQGMQEHNRQACWLALQNGNRNAQNSYCLQ